MEILNSYPIKSSDIASRILDGEAVVVLPMESTVYTFDPVGTRIWELITGNDKVSAIVKTIQNEYE
ncbi:MAG: PqqD family protein, partial [bacterium]|nr:PqqD family protein [bacterium]